MGEAGTVGLLPVGVKMLANGRCWHCKSIACGCEDVSKWAMPSQGLLPVGGKMSANGRCHHRVCCLWMYRCQQSQPICAAGMHEGVCVHIPKDRGSYFIDIKLAACYASAVAVLTLCMCRVGQNHIYTVYIRYFWQGFYQIYGHIRCIYTVMANPMYVLSTLQAISICGFCERGREAMA